MRIEAVELIIAECKWDYSYYEAYGFLDGVYPLSQRIALSVEFIDGYEDCFLEAREWVAFKGHSSYTPKKSAPVNRLW